MSDKNSKALEMLSKALEIEKMGMDFYTKAIGDCKNELGKKIFAMLYDDEKIHMQRINTIYSQLKENHEWTPDWKSLQTEHPDLNSLFKELGEKQGKNIHADSSDLQALDVGMDLEKRSIEFYKNHLDHVENDIEREFTTLMIGEEKSHFEALYEMKEFLSDPSQWFRNLEGHMYEG